ncbi:hypothetical protein RJ641_000746 [Dillenia turbinata]|uniref:Uncharacterized protein n=1 Tax=Dillenia turbinata TaxID=194707 RepID=A0AAN8W6V9_9MAGN
MSPPSYGWLSPRISFSRDDDSSTSSTKPPPPPPPSHPLSSTTVADQPDFLSDLELSGGDFEFRLDDPVTMLPADQLFSDGKLVPLQLGVLPQVSEVSVSVVKSPEPKLSRRRSEISTTDPYLFSPKAPRCSSRWKELLGLKKFHQTQNPKADNHNNHRQIASSASYNCKSLKHFLHRSSKSSSSSSDASLSLPLLKDLDSESVSISSRLSLSSSSSGHEHEDLPRLSLDSEKPQQNQNQNQIPLSKPNHNPNLNSTNSNSRSGVRIVKQMDKGNGNIRVGRSPMRRTPPPESAASTVDSPRMNSSGKIVFQGLERSSSSPSSFNGGPRFKHRGMERSYSANVRVTPVLNVPVCSLRGSSKSGSVFGFGQLFSSPQKKDNTSTSRAQHQHGGNSRNRTDRT